MNKPYIAGFRIRNDEGAFRRHEDKAREHQKPLHNKTSRPRISQNFFVCRNRIRGNEFYLRLRGVSNQQRYNATGAALRRL
jgi:hypothetical protein